jgi:hypothetical protein
MARIVGLLPRFSITRSRRIAGSRWTRVPDITVLLLIGVGLNAVLKDRSHFAATICSPGVLARILTLFEGGLDLRLKDAIRCSPGGILLA